MGVDSLADASKLTDKMLFQSRKKIGDAFQADFQDTLKQANKNGITFRTVSSGAASIERYGSGYEIGLESGATYFSHTVVLALGNVPNNPFEHLRGKPGYFHNPWAWGEYKRIDRGSKVAVLGLGPTAVDSILLLRSKEVGPITAISRTGRMQYPRPHNTDHVLRHISEKRLEDTMATLREHGFPGLSYDALLTLLTNEFEDARACAGYNNARKNSTLPAREALLAGLQGCDKVAPWFSIMKALDVITPLIWNSLDSQSRKLYLGKLRQDHTNLSYGMASVQAKRILECMDDHMLFVQSGLHNIQHTGSKFIVTRTEAGSEIHEEFDVVINATGIGSDVKTAVSPIIQSLLGKKWIVEHPDGGIRVDFVSGHVLNEAGKPTGQLYSLSGSLTFGTHLLTNCLWQVWESSERTAQSILDTIFRNSPRSR